MIDGHKIINSYIDCFGNEINEYEKIARYTVWYEGYLFFEDSDGLNELQIDDWDKAIELYNVYGDMIHIKDNEYGVSFDYGEWN